MMAFEPFIHFVRGIQGKLGTNVYSGLQGQNGQHIAFLRQIQKEMKTENDLIIPLSELEVTVFDLETTGFFPEKGDQILSIGAIKTKGSQVKEEQVFYSLVNYDKELPVQVKELTGLDEEELNSAPPLSNVLLDFYHFARGTPLVAHHSNHEKNFLQAANWKQFKAPQKQRIIDTSFLSRVADPELIHNKLEDLCERYGIPVVDRHHALGDAKLTALLWCIFIDQVQQLGYETLQDIYNLMAKL
jgi:DNA polymerase III subunit epsilon